LDAISYRILPAHSNGVITPELISGAAWTARILKFPERSSFDVAVRSDSDGWLVTAKSHGWIHADNREAIRGAEYVARTHGVAVKVIP
jgi:hypothetical protein